MKTFVVLFVVVMASMVVIGLQYKSAEKARVAAAAENVMLQDRMEQVVAVFQDDVQEATKSTTKMNDQEFNQLLVDLRGKVESCRGLQDEINGLEAQARLVSIETTALKDKIELILKNCQDGPKTLEMFGVYSCDNETFRKCVKYYHGTPVYNYDTDPCLEALNIRDECLDRGGISKYPADFESGT